jgi:alkylation response protein AidB-like acyl-CoA dehydrogenase
VLFDRGVLGVSAQLLGVAQHLLDVTVAYATEREQFGQPIGGFQAIKHHLTNVLLKLEFARPVVYRAAWTVARGPAADRPVHVSMAKAYAADAAELAAKTAIQVHGAIGYTFEFDLHLWMKRAWALSGQWGDPAWHRRRVREALLDG